MDISSDRLTDGTESTVRKRELEQILETTPVPIVILSNAGEIIRANTCAQEWLGLSRGELIGRRYDRRDWNIWDDNGVPIPSEEHPVSRVLATGEAVQGFTHGITLPDGAERWLSSNVAPVHDETGSIDRIIVALEDVTGLKRLERLIETIEPVRDILNHVSVRKDAEQAACELLTDSREYSLAWIGAYTPGTDLIELQARSGADDGFVEEMTGMVSNPDVDASPIRTTIESGSVHVVTRREPETRFESWREHTLECGFEGSAIVPLVFKDQTYGLLGLCTDRTGAFDDRETTLLATLGNRIGQVIHALETERLLHADAVTELTFRSTDSGSFPIRASEQLDCTIEIVEIIPSSEGQLVHFASLSGASISALGEVAESETKDVQLRSIQAREEPVGGTVQLTLHEQSLAQVLVQSGAVVTADRVTEGQAEVVCEIPADEDVQSLVNQLKDAFPETELVAKHEYDRSENSVEQNSSKLLADVFTHELTDRQRQVVRAAVHGGYFESPRRSTATELADALSVTQSTFSHHLRNAQQTLFEAMLERLQ
jgi:PAS domain S-box-containing protein